MPRTAHRMMTSITAALVTTMALGTASLVAAPVGARAATAPQYYLALGDSLAVGALPNAAGVNVPTDLGYPDMVAATLRTTHPGLQLVKLGCVGETTSSFINGGRCRYGAGSQLRQAERFLRAHRGHIALVTLSIGMQDVYGCISPAGASTACILKGVAKAALNLPRIAAGLRLADWHARMIATNAYNPGVAAWLQGASGHSQAKQSEIIQNVFNADIWASVRLWGFKVADVANAFGSHNWTIVDNPFTGKIPQNVLDLLIYTRIVNPIGDWVPSGPDVFGGKGGHGQIAAAVLSKA